MKTQPTNRLVSSCRKVKRGIDELYQTPPPATPRIKHDPCRKARPHQTHRPVPLFAGEQHRLPSVGSDDFENHQYV